MNFISSISSKINGACNLVRAVVGENLCRVFYTAGNIVQGVTVEKIEAHAIPQIIKNGNELVSRKVTLTQAECLQRIETMERTPIRVKDLFSKPKIVYPFPVNVPSDRVSSYGTFRGLEHCMKKYRPMNSYGDIQYSIIRSDLPRPNRPKPLNLSYVITAPEVSSLPQGAADPEENSISKCFSMIQSKYFTGTLRSKFTDICNRVITIPKAGNLRPHAAERVSKMFTTALINSTRETIDEVETCMKNRVYSPNILLEVYDRVKDRIGGISGYFQESIEAEFFNSFRTFYDSLKAAGEQFDLRLERWKNGELTVEEIEIFLNDLHGFNAKVDKISSEFTQIEKYPERLIALNSSASNEKITKAKVSKLLRFKKEVRAIGFDNKFLQIKNQFANHSSNGNVLTQEELDMISPEEKKELSTLIKGYLGEQTNVTLPGENIAYVKNVRKQLKISTEE